jgi:adenine-specific DNA methylase
MTDKPRLIEYAFPLKQASLDSVHEKNVRHGHISTLHIWPARRPLAACRAALIATLLPDPGDPEKRKELIEKIGGRVVEKVEKKKMPSGKTVETVKEETVGGILHWGRETENKDTLDWFREEIRKAYGGRAPKVLDPFAGGGAIPLEAMRLGCEATAIDINPVAWFILKCTLEYPQKLAGQKRPLPEFILKDRDFMEAFFKAQGLKGALLRTQLEKLGLGENNKPFLKGFKVEDPLLEADLAWHVRVWGKWVLNRARRDLAKFYPTYADFEPLKPSSKKWKKRAPKLVPLKEAGTPDIEVLNKELALPALVWVASPS